MIVIKYVLRKNQRKWDMFTRIELALNLVSLMSDYPFTRYQTALTIITGSGSFWALHVAGTVVFFVFLFCFFVVVFFGVFFVCFFFFFFFCFCFLFLSFFYNSDRLIVSVYGDCTELSSFDLIYMSFCDVSLTDLRSVYSIYPHPSSFYCWVHVF